MNWKKLKERFPNSEREIREFFNKSNISDSRTIINQFLISKGYNINYGFIHQLKNYENKHF